MKDRIWLIVNNRGVDRMVKTQSNTKIYSGEKRVQVDVFVPDAVFQPPPMLTAELKLEATNLAEEQKVVLDPKADVNMQRDRNGQAYMNKMAAQIFEKALNSTDRELAAAALEALQICNEAGIVVKIATPETDLELKAEGA